MAVEPLRLVDCVSGDEDLDEVARTFAVLEDVDDSRVRQGAERNEISGRAAGRVAFEKSGSRAPGAGEARHRCGNLGVEVERALASAGHERCWRTGQLPEDPLLGIRQPATRRQGEGGLAEETRGDTRSNQGTSRGAEGGE